MNEEELKEKYDARMEVESKDVDVTQKIPLKIVHGFPNEREQGEERKPIKIDFRGIKKIDDFEIYAPEAEVEIEYLDSRTSGDGILAWIKTNWEGDTELVLYWRRAKEEEILIQEVSGAERIDIE